MPRPTRLWRAFRACAALLGCAGAALCAPGAAAAQEIPAGFQEGIYEVVVAGLRPVSVPALLNAAGRPLLPVRAAAELTGTPITVEPGGRMVLARPRGVGSATLDLEARTLVAAARVTLAAEEAVRWGTDVYLEAARLGELLEASVTVDEAALTVALARDPPFPAQERLVIGAARRRSELLGLGVQAPRDLPDVPFFPRTGGGVLEWGVSSLFPEPGVPSSVYLRAGAGVWGGMLRVGGTVFNGAPIEGWRAQAELSYHRVFPQSRQLRQVQLGDVLTEGLRARSIRGVTVTNAPFTREALFGAATFAPRLPAGWEYELYQDGRLLGFSTTGSEAVSVPLRYGSTPVQVRMYGPAGQRVESSVVYLIPAIQLPAGTFQYAAGAGACPTHERCDAFGYADLRYGASQRLTVLGGVEAEMDSAAAAPRPYLGASLLPAPAWVVDAQAMPGQFARVQVQNFGAGNVTGGATAGVLFPRSGGTVIGSGGFSALPDTSARWHVDAHLRIRRFPVLRLLRAVDLGVRLDGTQHAGTDRMRLSAATAVRGVLLEGIVERDRPLTDSAAARTLTLVRASAWLGRWVRGAWAPTLLGSAGMGDEGLERWEAGVSLHPRHATVSAQIRWQRGAGSPSVVLGSSLRTSAGRAHGRVGTRDGRTEGGASMDGAVALSRGTPLETLPYGGLGLTGVSGRVFHDLDGDGRFGPGDEPVAGAAVGVGSIRVTTDSRGRYSTWSVLPYEILVVALDTTSLADPAWLAARPDSVLRPAPHLFTPVDFPLVQTREVAGRLVAGAGVPVPAGVTVEVVNRRSGAVERVLTFSDGEFYLGRVLPGEYELRIAESSLRALGAVPQQAAITFTVPASSDAFLVEVPPVVLVRPR